jgi:glucosylceramidase
MTNTTRSSIAILVLGVALSTLVVAPPASAQGTRPRLLQTVQVTLTTQDLQSALSPMPPLHFRASKPHLPIIAVNDAVRFQQITGFGAALTDSSAWLLYDELPPGARAHVLQDLFGSSGIYLRFVRIPVAASDFSATGVPYSYDDLPAGRSDPLLNGFSISHDLAYIVPTLQAILRINPAMFTFASPWSAPPWMKASDAFDNLLGQGILLQADYEPYAEYLVRFIEAYAESGIPITAITPENEPVSASAFPAMQLDEPAEAEFISQYLAPALAAAGLPTYIYGLDSGGGLAYAQALLSGPAQPSLSGIAWHCYGGMNDMSTLHEEFPEVDQLVSECSPGITPYSAAETAIDATRNWASAVALWNLALDPSGGPVQPPNSGCRGCTPLITVSEQTHQASLHLNYYQFGQVSKFVQPGAFRVASSRFVSDYQSATGPYGVTPGLDDVAFLNPNGTKVVVVDNNSVISKPFAIGWRSRYFSYTLPRKAVVTFVWR